MSTIKRLNKCKDRMSVKMTTIEYDTVADYIDDGMLGDIKTHYPDMDMSKVIGAVDELKRLIWEDEECSESGFISFSENIINDITTAISELIKILEEASK